MHQEARVGWRDRPSLPPEAQEGERGCVCFFSQGGASRRGGPWWGTAGHHHPPYQSVGSESSRARASVRARRRCRRCGAGVCRRSRSPAQPVKQSAGAAIAPLFIRRLRFKKRNCSRDGGGKRRERSTHRRRRSAPGRLPLCQDPKPGGSKRSKLQIQITAARGRRARAPRTPR